MARRIVLVVDDEEGIRISLRSALLRFVPDVEVIVAASAEEALGVLRARGVDVIMTDHRMPGMRGLDFLTEARRIAPGTSRILMTAYPAQDMIEQATNEARLTRFLTKPFSLEAAARMVAQVLEAREAEQQRQAALARSLLVASRMLGQRGEGV